MENKICSICNIKKPLTEYRFRNDKNKKVNKLRADCIDCCKKRDNNNYDKKNKFKKGIKWKKELFLKNLKYCKNCNTIKERCLFNNIISKPDGKVSSCKECLKNKNIKNIDILKQRRKKYYANNSIIIRQKNSLYSKLNLKKINIYLKNKKINNPLFKLRCNISSLIAVSIKRQGYTKKSKTFEILGCSYEDFKKHLERQFKKGMTWSNQGEWHLDHIYPVSLAKDEHEVIKLNHYTNFQPLWAKDNLEKNNKIIPNTQIKLI